MLRFFYGQAGKRLCRRSFQGSAAASLDAARLLTNTFGSLTITLALSLFLIGCSKKPVLDQKAVSDSVQVQENQISESDKPDLDFDLTKMNPNMIYAQVFNLMMEPENYDGKVFKITGTFIKVPGPDGKPSYGVIVKDALACCQQGIEFKYDFAGKEPAADQKLTVTGKFTVSYLSEGFMHNYVKADSVEM